MNKTAVYETLKVDEGVVYEIYLDHLGYKTLGVGHLVLESDPEHAYDVGEPVSVERVQECFIRDLDLAVDECMALYGFDIWCGFPGEVQEILVNMMFNMGLGRLSAFKGMKRGVDARDWQSAADEMVDSRWYNQVKNRADRLVERMRQIG